MCLCATSGDDDNNKTSSRVSVIRNCNQCKFKVKDIQDMGMVVATCTGHMSS